MKQNQHYKKWRRRLVHGGTTRLTKPASAESHQHPPNDGAPDSGVLRLDRSNRLPTALAEASETGDAGLMPSRLVLTITFAAIIFISIITWFISQMPNK